MERGEGSITTDARTGRKRARVCVDGKRITIPGSFDDDKQAQGAIAAFWKLRNAQSPTKGQGLMTVADWGETYLDQRETDGVHRSVDRDRARWRARIANSAVGGAYIDTLTAREVRAWVAEQIKTPTARGKRPAKQTVVNALNLLRVALEAAIEAGHIESNPSRDVRVPRIARDDEGWGWLRANEIDRVLRSPKLTAEQRRIFCVAIYTGMRKGELWGLRWTDVDFDREEIVVSRSYGEPTKGGKPRRVPLLQPALEAIREQRRDRNVCSLVFPTREPSMRGRNDSAGWEDVASLVGIREARFHDLRHTCASHLVQGTWAPELLDKPLRLEEVQHWLGHKSLRTSERYAHLCDESIRGRVQRAAREPSPEGERFKWTRVDAVDAATSRRAMQLTEMTSKSEVQTRFELVYDGFANRANMAVVPGGSAAPRPLRDQLKAILAAYAEGKRPSDAEVLALAEAVARALAAAEPLAAHA